jgi:hypothetical protein
MPLPRRTPLLVLSALVALASACGSSADDDPLARTHAALAQPGATNRFDDGSPAPRQVDAWSCSVHTTTWMLDATGNGVTWDQVSARMQSTGRVSPALGLTDASGAGVAATLRDFADGTPEVGSSGTASFDDVAARAGHMAVGIGGRAWNHWTAVRDYDAAHDVLLLANSAPGWRGVGQELGRGDFARLGTFSIAWLDYGQPAPRPREPAFVPSPAPAPSQPEATFAPLLVKIVVPPGRWITQCGEDASGQRVWQTSDAGPSEAWRWAGSMYPENVTGPCGAPHPDTGAYPLVFLNEQAGSFDAWITQCVGEGNQTAVYRVDGDLDGTPIAPFHHYETDESCP